LEGKTIALPAVAGLALGSTRSWLRNNGADPEKVRFIALVTAEALTLLVNQRMAREGMLGRCSNDDIRTALVLATSEFIGCAESVSGTGFVIERLTHD
jgi:hypothetical protein